MPAGGYSMSRPERDAERPPYAQVRARLVERLRSVAWKPGQPIANAFEIAYGRDDKPIERRVSLCHLGGAHDPARSR